MLRLGRAREGDAPADGLARNRIETSFGAFRRSPLEEREEPRYAAHRRSRQFTLEIRSANLFCWSLIPEHRYRDVVIVADLSFAERNAHTAMGFVLRYLDEGSFYYFLISNRGAFRFDLALNGNYIPLIEWTQNPLVGGRRITCASSITAPTSPSASTRSGSPRSKTIGS